MIEHPLPQNITEYRFHLIGNMTVKQFLILLAGAGIAFLFYTTNLPGILKWFLMILFFGAGAAAAFIPYEERTLDQWLINFIKAIYRPTKYFWRREPIMPDFFTYQPGQRASQADDLQRTEHWLPNRQEQIQSYLSSLQSGQVSQADPLDVFNQQTKNIDALFNQVPAAASVTPGDTQEELLKPDLQVRARPLRQTQTNPTAAKKTTPTVVHSSDTGGSKSPASHANSDPLLEAPTAAKPQPRTTPADQEVKRGTIEVAPLASSPSEPEKKASTPMPQQAGPNQAESYVSAQASSPLPSEAAQTTPVVFNRDLPFPSVPTDPNMLVGMVHNPEGNIIPGAIIEILDKSGNTVRAMKTNALGQFYISSPLKPGRYLIETEGQEYRFPVYELEIANTVLEPIEIRALTSQDTSGEA